MPSACALVRDRTIIATTLCVFCSLWLCTLLTAQVNSPNHLRVDISVGTTGQLFVSWDNVNGALYYNLQRSLTQGDGYTTVNACSGTGANLHTMTGGISRVCRDAGLTAGSRYYYRVQACTSNQCSTCTPPVSNVPVVSDCTPAQMPDMGAVKLVTGMSVVSSLVDSNIQFMPDKKQYAGYAAPSVPYRNQLVMFLPGSGGFCGGIGPIAETAEKLGFDVMCVNYSNAASQDTICSGDPDCFGNVSQAKLDATGPCSIPNGVGCGIDPATRHPYVNSNPADAVAGRIVNMLRFLSQQWLRPVWHTVGYLSGKWRTPLGSHYHWRSFARRRHGHIRRIQIEGRAGV
jgi:hypothetical protein